MITESDQWIGPTLCNEFRRCCPQVIADNRDLKGSKAAEQAVKDASPVDVLVVNLVVPAPETRAESVTDDEWRTVFSHIVDPLPRLVRAVLPSMINRRAGKIVVIGSAAALRGIKRTSTYSSARGAQVSYVRAVGTEVAKYNIQVNLIAPNFIDHPMFFPSKLKNLEAFKLRLSREVPLERMGTAKEIAAFAVFLASADANFFAGQCIPIAGGWAT